MQAAMSQLMERGFSGLTIEGVAAEAGVGKTTVYRRFPDKVQLVIAAMASVMLHDEAPDTGSLRGDLLAFHTHAGHDYFLRLLTGGGSTLIGTLLAEKERHPELIETFRRLVTDRRREQIRQVVDRAAARGEVGRDVDPDYVASVMFGSLIGRAIAGMEVSDRVIEQTVDSLINGIARAG